MFPNVTVNIDNNCCKTCSKPLSTSIPDGGCGCASPVIPAYEPNSPCKECETPCTDHYLVSCGFYDLADIPQLGIKTNDKLAKVIIILATEIVDLKRRLAAANFPV